MRFICAGESLRRQMHTGTLQAQADHRHREAWMACTGGPNRFTSRSVLKVISVALCTELELKALCLRVRVSPWSLDCPSTGASSHISIPRAKIADVCHHGQLEMVLKISLWINNHLSWNPTSAQWHCSKDCRASLGSSSCSVWCVCDRSAVWRGGANGLPFCLVCL